MLINNPVLKRELIDHLRSPRTFWLQFIFVATLSSVVLVAWPPEVLIIQKDQISRFIYDTFALGQLVLLALIAPVLSAPAIASERERKSLDLLLTSPLSPRRIILGKLLSAVAFLLLLTISSLPIFACCLFLGAAGPREIGSTFLLLFATGFTCGAIGLAASVYMQRVRGALSISYIIILPVVMILLMTNPMRAPVPAITISSVMLIIGIAIVMLLHRRIAKPFDTVPRAADEENTDEQIGLVLDRRRFPDSLLSPQSSGLPLDESCNPVYRRELNHELFGRGTMLIRLLLQVSMIAALPFFIAAYSTGSLWIYSFYVLVFIMLIAPSLTAGIFTQERERRTFDLLLTTAMTGRDILHGKLLVNLRHLALLLLFLIPFFPLFCLKWALAGNSRTLLPARYVLLLIGGTMLVVCATTLLVVLLTTFFSMLCRTTLRSMVLTYATLTLLFVLPAVLQIVLTRVAFYPPSTVSWVALTSPFFAVAGLDQVSPFRIPQAMATWQLVKYLGFALASCGLIYYTLLAMFRRYCQFGHDRRM